MSFLRMVLRTAGLIAAFLGFALIGLVLRWNRFLSTRRRQQLLAKTTRSWARCTCFFFNIRFKVVGDLNPKPGALIVANHVGSPDIFILGACFQAFYVSKAEIADWPGIKWLARLGETIFADRTRRHQIKEIISKIRERLEADLSVVMFPEAQATDGSGVLPFKASPFEAAALARRPVLPVAILYHDGNTPSIACWHGTTFWSHIMRLLRNPKLEATVHILPEIASETDRRVIAQKSHQRIRDKYLGEKNKGRESSKFEAEVKS